MVGEAQDPPFLVSVSAMPANEWHFRGGLGNKSNGSAAGEATAIVDIEMKYHC